MASIIDPGFKRLITPMYDRTNADGSVDAGAGTVEGVPTWELSDGTLATMVVNPDGLGGEVQHNGAVGEFTLTVRADGDLGAGVFPVVLSEVFTMAASLGATGGSLGIGDQVPIA